VIALDTNVLARLLLRDDRAQHAKILALLQTDAIFTAPVTVFVELVWVLEAHDLSAQEIAAGLNLLLGLENFKPAQGPIVRAALDAYAQGMDFADALHLLMSAGDESLRTFDKGFARQARALDLPPVVSVL
jgi:predicted nucleic-acid-binding protein